VPVHSAGREDLYDEEQLSRLSLEFIDSKIIACFDSQPFHSAFLIAEAIDISHTIVLRYL
jgi:hypothetical protein